MNIPRWGVLLIDILIALVSIGIAYLLRYNFHIPPHEYKFVKIAVPLIFLVRTTTFFIFKTYTGIIFHTSIEDAQRVFWAVTSGTVFMVLSIPTAFLFMEYHIIPYSIVIIDYFVMIFLMMAFRAFVKLLYIEMGNHQKDKKQVIIYGAGSAGVSTKKTLDRDAAANYLVNAFVDEDKSMANKKLLGVDIFPADNLDRLLFSSQPDMLVISTDEIEPERKQEIVELCLKHNVKVHNVPPMNKWINGELSFQQIRKIRIEDLLGRDEIKIDSNNISSELKGKTVLVTGAAGSIGSEIARQVLPFHPQQLILLDQAETPLYEIDLEIGNQHRFSNYEIVVGDIRNEERMRKVFKTFQPDIVFHAAAYKHVPLMENNPSESILTNIYGTKLLADLSVEYNVGKFVFISTDKAVNPTNIMGASKRVAETYVQSLNNFIKEKGKVTRFITTRFGNVLGSNGSVIPLFKKQIEEGGPVTVTHPEMTRYFMTIPEACQLVLEAGAMGKGGEIYVFDMGQSIKIVDLAKKMVRLSGLNLGKDIHIVFTGLRPGEKLHEELLTTSESTLNTHNKKIMIAKVRENDYEAVKKNVEELISLFDLQENEVLVKLMKEIIPEFKSNNSVFEKLDTPIRKEDLKN